MKHPLYILTLIVGLALSIYASAQNGSAQEIVAARQNEFSLNLFKQLAASDNGNVFISPLSISMACGMLANGASGETQDEIWKALGMENVSNEEIKLFYKNLLQQLSRPDTITKLKLANSLWIDKGFVPKESFVKESKSYFQTSVQQLELSDGASADVINNWAKKQTNGLIKQICEPSTFNDSLRLMLFNAVYFKSLWATPFNKELTQERRFFLTPKRSVMVDMMKDVRKIDYAAADNLQMVRLFYRGRRYCMDILLPNEDVSVEQMIDSLNTEKLSKLIMGLNKDKEVYILIPKFTAKYRHELNFDLQALGMENVFGSSADLSGISEDFLSVSEIMHDSYVKVDESGTKAAASTLGGIEVLSIREEPIYFHVDRPFLFFIRELRRGTILFAGKIVNPTIQ